MLRISLFLFTIFAAFTIQSVAEFGEPLISMPIGIAPLGVGAVKPSITFCA